MRWSYVLPLLAALLVPFTARADDAAEAKAAYARGREHFKAGQYEEAAAELKKAYALKPHPALLRYLGDTYYKMNKAQLAAEHYQKYLKEAPEAPDKEKIEAKVRQLELIIGAEPAGEEGPASAPAVLPPQDEPTATLPPQMDAPTGEDREVPVALARKSSTLDLEARAPAKRTRTLTILKWTTAAVGAAGLVLGIVFNRTAAAKAQELQDAVRGDCPPSSPDCGGNPDMNKPVVAFSERHYDLQQANKLHSSISAASLIVGGVLVGTSAVLFILDRKKERPAATAPRTVLAPMISDGAWGVAGGVSF